MKVYLHIKASVYFTFKEKFYNLVEINGFDWSNWFFCQTCQLPALSANWCCQLWLPTSLCC
jgi:hypothetical protein